MKIALESALISKKNGEVPVGAVIVRHNEIVSMSGNRSIVDNDPTAHAEILVIRNASKVLNNRYLNECDLYVTLEPCPMCMHAISLAKVRRVYFGAYYFNINADKYNRLSIAEVYGGIMEKECSDLMKEFFINKRLDEK